MIDPPKGHVSEWFELASGDKVKNILGKNKFAYEVKNVDLAGRFSNKVWWGLSGFCRMTSEILTILNEKKSYLHRRYSISKSGIFGSYARGDFNEKSDIDIFVDFNGRIEWRIIKDFRNFK